MLDALAWIERTLRPEKCSSTTLLYDHMASQSERNLPIIYQPFDVENRGHWGGRGAMLDYLHSTGGGRVLDFGPGDGWPSLILAPFVEQVVGVDGSQRRVDECRENAARLGIANATFTYVPPGSRLPFEDAAFDSVVAASSIEQTPDPLTALRELHRVLRPGGRLRVYYEALVKRRKEPELGGWLLELDERRTRLMVEHRDAGEERATHYGLTLALTPSECMARLAPGAEGTEVSPLTIEALERVHEHVIECVRCTLRHPSGPTLGAWLAEIGFRNVLPTHSGGRFAWQVFEALPAQQRPRSREALDDYLSPLVKTVVSFEAPLDQNPMITAVK